MSSNVFSRMLTMDFYGRNDITLGAFLERYCFSPTYTCPSQECSVPVRDHIRKFVHESGCVDVVLRKLDSDMGVAAPSSIHVWSWCKVCKQVCGTLILFLMCEGDEVTVVCFC